MSKKKKQIYVVVQGRQPGVYASWLGEEGAAEQVKGFSQAKYRGFYSWEEAVEWLGQLDPETLVSLPADLLELIESLPPPPEGESPKDLLQAGKVLIYTDGGVRDNPGPGGYGIVLRYKVHKKELSGGFRKTTNNRMELMACILGLQALKIKSSVVLFSDSSYVVNGMTQGWAQRWQAENWALSNGEAVKNADLWRQLVDLGKMHDVEFRWVRGHSGNPDNERCDQLATAAAQGDSLQIDEAYETEHP